MSDEGKSDNNDQLQLFVHDTRLDADKYGNEALGEVRLPLFKLQPDLTYHYNMFLEPPIAIDRSDSVSSRSTQSSHYGEKSRLLLSLKYSTKRKALIVGVVRCQNLPPMDLNGLADPLIRVRLRPDSLRRDYATETRKGTLNPEFNQEFVFESLINELPRKTLEIGVWHRDIGRKKNFIGGLQIGIDARGEKLRHWYEAVKEPDIRHDKWQTLSPEPLLNDPAP